MSNTGSVAITDAVGNFRKLEDFENDYIQAVIGLCNGAISAATRKLEIGRSTLYRHGFTSKNFKLLDDRTPKSELSNALTVIAIHNKDGEIRTLEDARSDVIRAALINYKGSSYRIAHKLGIGRSTLYRMIKDLGLSQLVLDARTRTDIRYPQSISKNELQMVLALIAVSDLPVPPLVTVSAFKETDELRTLIEFRREVTQAGIRVCGNVEDAAKALSITPNTFKLYARGILAKISNLSALPTVAVTDQTGSVRSYNDIETDFINVAMDACQGNVSVVARHLDLTEFYVKARVTAYNRILTKDAKL
jgi:transcriptional regulator of acetoin/glycerol metabolism